jgi:hypothetical protein
MLEELMNKIARQEKRWDRDSDDEDSPDDEEDLDGLHSFWPEQWPTQISPGPYEDDENAKLQSIDDERNVRAKCKALKRSRRFLPCHYFDYTFGSSTGA